MQKVTVCILTCSNTTQILDCPVSACIKYLTTIGRVPSPIIKTTDLN